MYDVILSVGGKPAARFSCPDNLSVLRAALNAGIELSAGCMQGRCFTCRSHLHGGKVKSTRPLSRYATVDPADLGDNTVLLCAVRPDSDITVEPRGPWRIIEEEGTFELLAPELVPDWVS